MGKIKKSPMKLEDRDGGFVRLPGMLINLTKFEARNFGLSAQVEF